MIRLTREPRGGPVPPGYVCLFYLAIAICQEKAASRALNSKQVLEFPRDYLRACSQIGRYTSLSNGGQPVANWPCSLCLARIKAVQ